MTVRALTFDVVGTLIDFETGLLEAARPASADGFLAAFGEAEGEQQRRTPEMPFPAMLDPISERLGIPSLRGSVVDWPAFDDAPAALAALGRRYRLVALTNADRAATAAMSRTLGDPFDDVVTAEDVGVNKPDPQMFAWCLGRLSASGIGRDEVLHVAQSQFHDITAARRLGIATCWVERRRGRAGSGATPSSTITVPDRHVGTLAELAAALLSSGSRVSAVDIPPELRAVVETGPLVHLTTINADGSPQVTVVWAGFDGGDLVTAHLPRHLKIRNMERDPRVVLSFLAPPEEGVFLQPYAVLRARATVEPSDRAWDVLDALAKVYLSPDETFPAPRGDGFVVRYAVEKISGVGPWAQ